MRALLTAVLMLVAMGSGVRAAEILAGGAGYGGPPQYFAVCYLFNAGSSAVTVSKISIYTEAGSLVSPQSNGCGGSLAPLKSCQVAAIISNAVAHSCKATVGSKANLRGRLEFRTQQSAILSAETLR